MKKTLIALSITSALISTSSFANQTKNDINNNLETIVVTANRTPQTSTDILSSVKVINRADIDLSPANSVAELLNNVNGLQMSQAGGSGQQSSVFSRGTESRHTLVIIDGQRVGSATLGSVSYGDLSLTQIERVEIIKGPRAALWGSDAIGGVIQIFTRKLEGGGIAADIAYGNMNQKQASISVGLVHGDGSTAVTASSKSSDGYDVFAPTESDDDGYDRENISLVGYQKINDSWRVNYLAKYDQGTTYYDDTFGGDTNTLSFDTLQWRVSADQNDSQSIFSQSFSLGYQEGNSVSYGGTTSEKDGDNFETTRLKASWLGNIQISKLFTSTSGFDLSKEEIKTADIYAEDSRNLYAAFTRLAFDNSSQIIDGAVRYDDMEGVDSKTTFNMSLGQRFSTDSLISLNIGTGFKTPTFNDLYYPTSGNPDLKSETSTSIELLLQTNIGNVKTDLSLYQTKIDDLIDWLCDASWNCSPANINTAEINGIELTLSTQVIGFYHEIQLNYLDAVDSDTDKPLIRRAKETGSYLISKGWDVIDFQASIHYQGEREDSGNVTLDSYTLVNLSVNYHINESWEVGVKVNNAFDEEYFSLNNYNGQPAQYLLTVSYLN